MPLPLLSAQGKTTALAFCKSQSAARHPIIARSHKSRNNAPNLHSFQSLSPEFRLLRLWECCQFPFGYWYWQLTTLAHWQHYPQFTNPNSRTPLSLYTLLQLLLVDLCKVDAFVFRQSRIENRCHDRNRTNIVSNCKRSISSLPRPVFNNQTLINQFTA